MNATRNNAWTKNPLKKGTFVINTNDGEPGTIVNVYYRRNGIYAYAYMVRTAEGLEEWYVNETIVPEVA